MRKNQKGFTLIEVLLYVGITAIIAGSIFGILNTVTKTGLKQSASNEASTQLNFVMQTVQGLVKSSSLIESPTATTTATSTLKLRMEDYSKDPTCISLVGGIIKLAEGPDENNKQNCTSTLSNLTDNNVVVDQLDFKKFSQYPGHDVVSLNIQITSGSINSTNRVTRNLQASIARVSAATFDSDLVPGSTGTFNVGNSSGNLWKNAAFSGILSAGSLFVSGNVGIGTSTAATLFSVATSTNIFNVLSNGNVGIGTANPGATLELRQPTGNNKFLSFTSPDVAHGMTAVATTDTYGYMMKNFNTSGGLAITGLTDADGSQRAALTLQGFMGEAAATSGDSWATEIMGGVKNGTGIADVAATGHLFGIRQGSSGTTVFGILGNGNVGIGMIPTNKLDVNGTISMTGFKMASGATSGYVLTTNASGVGTWQAAAAASVAPAVDSVVGTSDINTNSTTYVDMPDMTYTDTFAAGNIYVTFLGRGFANGGGNSYAQLTIDDVAVDTYTNLTHFSGDSGTELPTANLSYTGAVTAASHTIKVRWKTGGAGVLFQYGAIHGRRILTIIRGLN